MPCGVPLTITDFASRYLLQCEALSTTPERYPCVRLCLDRRKVSVSQVLAGQQVGVRQVTDRIWLVSFMEYDRGYFDDETCGLQPIARSSAVSCGYAFWSQGSQSPLISRCQTFLGHPYFRT